jgi:hypothetical protein
MQKASQQVQTDTSTTQRTPEPSSGRQNAPRHYSGNRAALRRLSAATPPLQCKLTVGSANDPLEAEADRVAEHVMRMPNIPALASDAPPQISRKCDHCKEEEEKGALQRKENGDAPRFAPPPVENILSASGQPLDTATRAYMEPRFGHDFGRVRVHTGAAAAESARAISALAFTSAHNVVFGPGQYSPGTDSGRRLLAHELTHVVQQQTGSSVIRRDETPVDAAALATDVEHMVRPGNDEKGALDKLKALDMAVLLKVAEQIYNDADATSTDEGKRRAFAILNGDLTPPTAGNPAASGTNLSEDERIRVKAAFDAAPSRKLRNPTENDPGTNPTLSGYRDQSAATGPARPGDWGEDPSHNTWVAHSDGIRSYFGSGVPSKMRTSTWLGNNPSNFDYAPSLTKRAISSFHWGTGVHHFAVYLSVADASADLRDRMKPFSTIISYIRVHLGNNPKDNNRSPEAYVQDMQRAVAVNGNDPVTAWTADDTKWASLIEGFKSAEGWKPVPTITAANVKSLSSDPKDAALIAYYQRLLGATS